MPPRPKVKASGGEPITMSSGVAWSTWRGQASQAASTSRWVCTAALGVPVVPEVKAIIAMSSAEVRQGANWPSLAGRTARRSEPALVQRVEGHDGREHRVQVLRAACSSASRPASHSATVACDLVDDVAELLGAQQRHGGHGDQPGLDHPQPGQRHADGVAAAQQHAVAGHQLQVVASAPGRCG